MFLDSEDQNQLRDYELWEWLNAKKRSQTLTWFIEQKLGTDPREIYQSKSQLIESEVRQECQMMEFQIDPSQTERNIHFGEDHELRPQETKAKIKKDVQVGAAVEAVKKKKKHPIPPQAKKNLYNLRKRKKVEQRAQIFTQSGQENQDNQDGSEFNQDSHPIRKMAIRKQRKSKKRIKEPKEKVNEVRRTFNGQYFFQGKIQNK